LKILKLIVPFFILTVLGCKVSQQKNLANKKISSGIILFEEFEVESSLDSKTNLKAFRQITNSVFDSILRLDKKTINEIKTSGDSLSISFINKNFDAKGNLKDEFFLSSARDTSLVKIIIKPDKIFIPESSKALDGTTKFYDFGKVINRDSLFRCFGKIQKNCPKKRKVNYLNEDNYDIIYFQNNRKMINGYDCFLIRCYSKKGFYRYDLYVTSNIDFNYNHLFNLKSLTNEGYFVLEKTLYTQLSVRTTRLKNIDINYFK